MKNVNQMSGFIDVYPISYFNFEFASMNSNYHGQLTPWCGIYLAANFATNTKSTWTFNFIGIPF